MNRKANLSLYELGILLIIVITGCTIIWLLIIKLAIIDENKMTQYCNKYGSDFTWAESGMEYSSNIKICYKVLENGTIIKYYFDKDKI